MVYNYSKKQNKLQYAWFLVKYLNIWKSLDMFQIKILLIKNFYLKLLNIYVSKRAKVWNLEQKNFLKNTHYKTLSVFLMFLQCGTDFLLWIT